MNKNDVKDYFKRKAEGAKAWCDVKAYEAGQWAKEHPSEAATIVCTAIGAIGIIIRRSGHNAKIRREQRLKDRYVYDRSLGRYWMLKRRPTQSEQLAIESMKKQGLGYGDILTRLKLL